MNGERARLSAALRCVARAPARTARRQLLKEFLAGADIDPGLIEPIERQRNRAELLHFEALSQSIGRDPNSSRKLYEAVIGTDDTLPRRFLSLGELAARAVGRIVVPTDQGVLYGTGSLVSHRLILTNHHVVESAAAAARAWLELGYYAMEAGTVSPERAAFRLDPDSFFWTNEALDYSLVGVEAERDGATTAQFGRLDLIASSGKALIGEHVNIVHHPGGQPQTVSIRENQVADLFDQWLHYVADTAAGSSGAAVFNDEWQLVALHHAAVPDGRQGVVNEGIRISVIVDDLVQAIG